jgi:hypothetical protein
MYLIEKNLFWEAIHRCRRKRRQTLKTQFDVDDLCGTYTRDDPVLIWWGFVGLCEAILGSGYKTKFTITSYWWSFYCDLLSWEETRFTWESGRELKGQKSLEKIAASRYICTYYISALVTVSFEAEIPLISSFHWSLCENPISGTGVSAKSLPSRNLLHDRKHDAVSAVLGWRQRAILNFTPLG